MLLAEEKNIREVTMFPMNQNAQDLMMNAPSEVDENQLKELNISKRKINYFFPLRFILISDKSTSFFFVVVSNKTFACNIFYKFN